MWSLADPWMLLLLAVPLVLARGSRQTGPADQSGAMRVPRTVLGALGLDTRIPSGGRTARSPVLAILIWILLVAALAGPQRLTTIQTLPVSSRDIVIALDLSGSMEREDFSLDGVQTRRIDVVKSVAARFVRQRAGDRVGLVIFAEHAFVAAPLSHDVETVAATLEAATIGISGRSTAISDGLGLALRRLDRATAPGKVVILLSDGINNAGSVVPRDAAALAADLGVRVHTIAFGPRDMSDGGDLRDVVDADTLRDIAQLSGGRFFRARTTEDLRAVSTAINDLEGTPAVMTPTRLYRSYWIWPALAALLLVLISAVPATGRQRWQT